MMSEAESQPPQEAQASNETPRDHSATATQERPQAKPESSTKPLPPWKPLLHNDDGVGMDDVVDAIVLITPLTQEVALRKMLEAHTRGRSLLLTTHRELAELYRERFKALDITTTLEPGD